MIIKEAYFYLRNNMFSKLRIDILLIVITSNGVIQSLIIKDI